MQRGEYAIAKCDIGHQICVYSVVAWMKIVVRKCAQKVQYDEMECVTHTGEIK